MFFAEWKELKRHFHNVTVWDAVKLEILKGELREMIEKIPTADKIKANPKPIRAALSAIATLIKQLPRRRALIKKIKHIGQGILPPAELVRKNFQNEEDDPRKIPCVTWYAYVVDLLASEYGWKESDIRLLPYAALSEFILAIEVRRVAESSRRVAENNPTENGIEALNNYPRRKMEIPRKVMDEYFAKQRAKLKKHFGG